MLVFGNGSYLRSDLKPQLFWLLIVLYYFSFNKQVINIMVKNLTWMSSKLDATCGMFDFFTLIRMPIIAVVVEHLC